MNMFWEVFENCRTCSHGEKVLTSSEQDSTDGIPPADLFLQCKEDLQAKGWVYLPIGAVCPTCVDVIKVPQE